MSMSAVVLKSIHCKYLGERSVEMKCPWETIVVVSDARFISMWSKSY